MIMVRSFSCKRIETQQEQGCGRHILDRIQQLYSESVKEIQAKPHTFGIGTPGAISPRTGLLKNSNTVCLNGQPLKVDLETLLGRKIGIQNDANCFALAEALHGAGRGKNLVFGVIMGTGCGGGIVHKGEVIAGRQAIAGEWGTYGVWFRMDRFVTAASAAAWSYTLAAAVLKPDMQKNSALKNRSPKSKKDFMPVMRRPSSL